MTETNAPLRLIAMVLDCPEPRELAEFYGRLLGWSIDAARSDDSCVELADPSGGPTLAFQYAPDFRAPTWPEGPLPQMAHLDIRVSSIDAGSEIAERAGAKPLPQPPDCAAADFRVYADPAGHPFCLCACPE